MERLAWAMVVLALAAGAIEQIKPARAQESEAEYRELLGIAQKSIEHKRERAESRRRVQLTLGARLGASQIARLGLNRRFYETGQSWRVRFTPSADPSVAAIARKSEQGAAGRTLRPTEFAYVVVEVGAPPGASRPADDEARIRVSQLPGEALLDARVEYVLLTVGRDFVPRKREIHYRDGRAPIVLLYAGTGPLSMGFDATPLELPNLSEDEGTPTRDGGVAALRFRTQDVYARPVEALWREGDPWPAEVKTVAGTAKLLR